MKNLISVILSSNKSSYSIINSLRSLIDDRVDGVEYLVNLDNVNSEVRDQIMDLGIDSLKISTHNGSLAETLNILISSASGEYIARADDDDVYSRGRLKLQLEYLMYRKDVHVVGAAMYTSRHEQPVGRHLYPATHDEICLASILQITLLLIQLSWRGQVFSKRYPIEIYQQRILTCGRGVWWAALDMQI